MTNRPPPGTMVLWRFKAHAPSPYVLGYCTYHSSYNMVRMGFYNGDTTQGPIVDINETEWKPYS